MQQSMIILPPKHAYKYLTSPSKTPSLFGADGREVFNSSPSVEVSLPSPLLQSTFEWELRERLDREAQQPFP